MEWSKATFFEVGVLENTSVSVGIIHSECIDVTFSATRCG
jgi:hypothetical protein